MKAKSGHLLNMLNTGRQVKHWNLDRQAPEWIQKKKIVMGMHLHTYAGFPTHELSNPEKNKGRY